MNPGPTASATIELTLDTTAPTGVLTDGDRRARRFSGWIELAAAIEDWRTSMSQAVLGASPTQQPSQSNRTT